ncbi:MAG: DNA mismatch repair protein MutS [Acidobacteriota bacterium]|nr:MAG: DNA mismatch repair protein MutS [Acidobacteriota bacterium]
MEKLTPMMRQYHKIKMEHPDILLFFRLGDFYEMFYEDAVVGSRELEITLTSRNKDSKGAPIPMCGIPHHAATTYVSKLLRKGFKVAICEQVEDPSQAKGIVKREVARILTPGTAIEEGVLETRENNFIASLVKRDDALAASFLDVSTGEFWVTEFSGELACEKMEQEWFQFQPREVIFPESSKQELEESLAACFSLGAVRTPQADWVFNLDYSQRVLLQHFQVQSLDGFGLNGEVHAMSAAGGLLNYVKETQKTHLTHITGLTLIEQAQFLKMDDSTIRNLELVQGIDGNRKWTLLATLDMTKTGMGARLLRRWLLRPSLDLAEINERLDAVDELTKSVMGMSRLGGILNDIYDLERLLSRVTMEKANARDLLSLRESLRSLPRLDEALAAYETSGLSPRIDHLEDVLDLLDRSIADDPPVTLNEGRIMRSGYNAELDELREISRSGKSFIARLESQERDRTGIPSLKVKFNRVFGYFIEVSKTRLDAVPEDYIRKQTLASSERFITPELKEYEDKVLGAEERIIALERELFVAVRSAVADQAGRIQQVARVIATLDVLLAFAETAQRHRYVRPQLDESTILRIQGGRHPVLELQGNDPFVPNDLLTDADHEQMLILTGPNMGGKSTYLRQNALIVIMAQAGSFVPAAEAQVGLVDRIFTRVGASDNLARGRSTFMVEMIETAKILNTATRRSFILLDEVGRGTATFDGLSIAWSVAEYLVNEESRRARTLFATHYQELTKLEELYDSVRNYCVTVREGGKDIIFFHRVMPGIANKSYGIEVARLAGVPQAVIERAREVLTRLERKQLNLTGRKRSSTVPDDTFSDLQKGLF